MSIDSAECIHGWPVMHPEPCPSCDPRLTEIARGFKEIPPAAKETGSCIFCDLGIPATVGKKHITLNGNGVRSYDCTRK